MRQNSRASLWESLSVAGDLAGRFLLASDASVSLSQFVHGSSLGGQAAELRGKSVLLATKDQLTAALALLELDGVARRVVLCPPDLPLEHVPSVIASANIEAIVSDRSDLGPAASTVGRRVHCGAQITPAEDERRAEHQTEWILFTSGTTGLPKLVVHTLRRLAGAIPDGGRPTDPMVWSTFYDIRRYGGLQIFLRAILTGASLVLSNAHEPLPDFLARASAHKVTHISGTPSHWRRALMSPAASLLQPQYTRLSGEIADQAILDHLQCFYPQARVSHAFASTEAGVVFDVTDRREGFPADVLEHTQDVEIRVVDDSLHVRSARTALRYLGAASQSLMDAEGFVDTGDLVQLRDNRYHFVGRRNKVINVGGLKVHPEEVEAVINRHPNVQMSLVRSRKNPVLGALVVADVVAKKAPGLQNEQDRGLRDEILQLCRKELPPHKVPSAVNLVPVLAVAENGKLVRSYA